MAARATPLRPGRPERARTFETVLKLSLKKHWMQELRAHLKFVMPLVTSNLKSSTKCDQLNKWDSVALIDQA